MDAHAQHPDPVLLEQHGFHPWFHLQRKALSAWVRGSAWRSDRLLDASAMASALIACMEGGLTAAACDRAADWLADCNGAFSVVVEEEGRLFAAVDRFRLWPLFYTGGKEGPRVGDRAEALARAAGLSEVDPWSEKEYLLSGYVLGDRTLLCGLKQLVAGECLAFLDKRVPEPSWRRRTFTYTGEEYEDWNESAAADTYVALQQEAVQRLVRQYGNRTLAIPLSGGLDSRCVAVMLKQAGARDVRCFSYGRPGNHDARISRRVAQRLGFPWHFVPYSRSRWRAWFSSEERRTYSRRETQLNSFAHLQDFPAVWELTRSGVLPEGTLFVPGHGWQMELEYGRAYNEDQCFGSPCEAGDRRTPRLFSREDLVRLMMKKHFGIFDWQADEASVMRHLEVCLERILGAPTRLTPKAMVDAVTLWNGLERLPKITFNSVRVYESWNGGWALPLCDHAAADLYNRVPAARKVRRRFLLQAQVPRLLEPWGLDRALGRYSSRSIMAAATKADRRVKQLSRYADLAYHLEYHLFGRFHDRCIHGMLPKEVYFKHVHALEPWKASSLHLAACHHYIYREMMSSFLTRQGPMP